MSNKQLLMQLGDSKTIASHHVTASAYFAENYKTVIRAVNDVAKFAGQDGVEEGSVKSAFTTAHVAQSVVNAYLSDDATPLLNTALFYAKEHTDVLKSDSVVKQCGIDMVAAGVSGLATFDINNAAASMVIAGVRCGAQSYLGEDSNVVKALDVADTAKNLLSPSHYMVKGLEVVKGVYKAMDYGVFDYLQSFVKGEADVVVDLPFYDDVSTTFTTEVVDVTVDYTSA